MGKRSRRQDAKRVFGESTPDDRAELAAVRKQQQAANVTNGDLLQGIVAQRSQSGNVLPRVEWKRGPRFGQGIQASKIKPRR